MGKTGNTDLYPITTPENQDYAHGYSVAKGENVSFRVSELGGNSDLGIQDNKTVIITSRLQAEGEEAWEAIDGTDFTDSVGTTYYEVSDTQSVIWRVPRARVSSGRTELYYDFYVNLNNGKGRYGVGGVVAVGEMNNLFFLSSTEPDIVPSNPDGSQSTIYTFYVNDLLSPHTALNAGTAVAGYPISNDGDYYVELIQLGLITPTGQPRSLWKFTGDASGDPVFGVNGDGSTANLGDFTQFDLSEVATSSQKILVPKLVVGSVINGTGVPNDDIHLAVNRSFRGVINITESEVKVFEAQRNVPSTNNAQFAIWTEKYLYTKGRAIINSDSVREDFELMYEKKISGDIPVTNTSNPPSVIPLLHTDLDDPAGAINASSDTYLINGDRDWVFIIYETPDSGGAFKMYSFSSDAGDYGTYGNSGGSDLANNGQLTEISQVADVPVSPDWFEEITEHYYLGKRLRIKSSFLSTGFSLLWSGDNRSGIDIINDSTGSNAVASLVLRDSASNPFTGFQASLYGPNYYSVALRGKGGIITDRNMTYATWNDNDHEWYSAPADNLNLLALKMKLWSSGAPTLELPATTIDAINSRGVKAVPTVEYLNDAIQNNLVQVNELALQVTLAGAVSVGKQQGFFEVGKTYVTYETPSGGDDFTNVGYLAVGTPFVAIAAIPTNWDSNISFVNVTDATHEVNVVKDTLGLDWGVYQDNDTDSLVLKVLNDTGIISPSLAKLVSPATTSLINIEDEETITIKPDGSRGFAAWSLVLHFIGPQYNWEFQGGSIADRDDLLAILGIPSSDLLTFEITKDDRILAGIRGEVDMKLLSPGNFTTIRQISDSGFSYPSDLTGADFQNDTLIEEYNNADNTNTAWGDDVFNGATALKSIRGAFELVASCGDRTFKGASSLNDVLYNNNLSEVTEEMFYGTAISIPQMSSATIIRTGGFRLNTMAKALLDNLLSSVVEVEARGFAEMPNLAHWEGTNVTTFGDECFIDCPNLLYIDMFGATTLGTDVFDGLPNGGTLRIPAALNANANVTYLSGKGWAIVNV